MSVQYKIFSAIFQAQKLENFWFDSSYIFHVIDLKSYRQQVSVAQWLAQQTADRQVIVSNSANGSCSIIFILSTQIRNSPTLLPHHHAWMRIAQCAVAPPW